MHDNTKEDLLRRMDMVVPRLFDDQPLPAITALRALVTRLGAHPTELGFSINGAERVRQLEKDLDIARNAANRAFTVFETACKAKGYASAEAAAEVLNIDRAYVRECRVLGKMPAIFFRILADAPSKDTRTKQMRAMMVEAKRKVREEADRRRQKRKQKAKPAARAATVAVVQTGMPTPQARLDVAPP